MIRLKIFQANVDQLPNEEYAMVRKNSFGASDVATLFGIGFGTLEDMIATKALPYLTEEEKGIGDLPNVRKGRDLEPLILQKYIDKYGTDDPDYEITKPVHMYEIIPGLTVNFDATAGFAYPIEIKYVSTFGHKNYDTSAEEFTTEMVDKQQGTIQEHIKFMAKKLGIPPYYYTQLQTQIVGLDSQFGVLTALFEKDWTLRTYKCPADPFFRKALFVEVVKSYNKLCKAKGIELKKEETKEFTY